MKHRAMCVLVAAVTLGLGTACTASDVKPPKQPHVDQPLTDEQVAKLPVLKQPAALKDALTGLSKGSIEERKAKLKKYVLSHLVFVKGGSFQMGDFGPIWLASKLPLTDHKDDKVLHKVTLSSYSIEAYKTTYAAFDVYSDATKTTRAGMDKKNLDGAYRNPYVPAGVYWPQARDYCQWLGNLTGLPFALPTEAQWEYAARNRGRFFAFSTDNGNLNFGRNIAGAKQRALLAASVISKEDDVISTALFYPVGLFPPSPLGLYGMGVNGQEWTHDYYGADYYAHSQEIDPTGPKNGSKRVVRGFPLGGFYGGITMFRKGDDPLLMGKDILTGKIEPGTSIGHNVRCVVDQLFAETE